MDARRNCKGQSDPVSGCGFIWYIPRPGTTLLRLIYRDWALKHHSSQSSSWGAQTCRAEQVILRQIQEISFLLPLLDVTGCCRAQSTAWQPPAQVYTACWRQISKQQHPSSTFCAGTWFLHDRDEFLPGENSLGASHPEELLQLHAPCVLQLPCPRVRISQGHSQQHLQLQLGNGP